MTLGLKLGLALLLLAVLAYASVLGVLYRKQESLLFFPTVLPADFQFGLRDVEEQRVPVDGAVLSALHFRQRDAKGLIFFLHGNGGSLREWLPSTDVYRRAGFDVFMVDYRGYGKSTGRIQSEAQLHADVRAAWDSVSGEYRGRPIVLYGRSLGTGLATKLATQVDAQLLVLVSPYFSLLAAARERFPWVPGFVMRYPMRTDQWLPRVTLPVLMLHGDRDEVVPVEHAERLLALLPSAQLVRLPQANHEDIHLAPRYLEVLLARLDAIPQKR